MIPFLTLAKLGREIQLIARVTPKNAEAELVRLVAAFDRGEACLPRWEHASHDVSALEEALLSALAALRGIQDPLAPLVRGRLEEMRLEAAMVASVGSPAFARFAAQRYAPVAVAVTVTVTVAVPDSDSASDSEPRIPSDSAHPSSLLSQVRALVGAHRAPFAVRPTSTLQALAATGERTVYIARGRALTERDARRVAVHEVLGHVLPRVRAESAHPIFTLGTARGTDDQEGLALLHEERAGLLDAPRRAELGRRHLAAHAMRQGADFVEVVGELRHTGAELEHALRIAARVFRGSDGTFPGLGRESVYLPALACVRAHLASRPRDEAILGCGRIATEALPLLIKALPAREPEATREERHRLAEVARAARIVRAVG